MNTNNKNKISREFNTDVRPAGFACFAYQVNSKICKYQKNNLVIDVSIRCLWKMEKLGWILRVGIILAQETVPTFFLGLIYARGISTLSELTKFPFRRLLLFWIASMVNKGGSIYLGAELSYDPPSTMSNKKIKWWGQI